MPGLGAGEMPVAKKRRCPVFPTLGEVRSFAESREYRRVPVAKELIADRFTPIEVVRAMRSASRHCFLLESAEQDGRQGRYSFLGFRPTMEITCQNGLLRVREGNDGEGAVVEERVVAHPGPAIREVLARYKSPQVEGMPPLAGGLVGYFSYDYIKYAEPVLRVEGGAQGSEQPRDFRDVDLMLFDEMIVFDHLKQKVLVVAGVSLDDPDGVVAAYRRAEARIDAVCSLLDSGAKAYFPPLRLTSPLRPRFSREEYARMVERAKGYIREGDIFQVVLSNPQTASAEGSMLDVYRVMRTANPSPYMFYFASDDIEIAGASPETLARLENGTVRTFPLAGTRPRGENEAADRALEAELLADKKELAEHNMLVDLGRNDLGKICELGSVSVERYLSIHRFSHVMHIGSEVSGKLACGFDAVDAVDAILPAGTLSGAPKLRACQIIEELEGAKRGIYGGAVGYLDFAGNLDTCISIRLAYKKDGQVCVQSGAGIVADSDPDSEYEECRNKARAVVAAIERAEGGIR